MDYFSFRPPPLPDVTQTAMVLQRGREPRLLGRRYPLTRDFSKYLEIGVCLSPNSFYVELAIGDNRGNEIPFVMHDWKEMLYAKQAILAMFDEPREPMDVGVTLVFQKLLMGNGIEVMKISNTSKAVYVTPKTMQNIFEFAGCIDHMFTWLSESIPAIMAKFKTFVEILRSAKNADYRAAIMEDARFEKHCLIDCELVALGMDMILGEVLMVRSMESTANHW